VATARHVAQLSLRENGGHLPGAQCDEFRGPHSYLSVPLSDAAIAGRVLAGDTEASAVLVERYYERCARYAVRVIGNREDAEEAVQDTLLRAFRSLHRYEERGQFASWLFRILANQCRSTVARVARRERKFPDLYADDARPVDVGPNGDGETLALHDSSGERLDTALAQLPPDQREALALRFGESLSYEDMSAITGAGVSALKMRVSRATARLRVLLMEVHHV
jgi:RNA polymerase sigma-70 factor (ECF subfamily)